MKKSHGFFRSFIIFILLNSVVINAYSISISARRLYLDPNSDSTNIRVLNLDAKIQQCTVAIKDVVINDIGNIALVSNGEPTANSAKPLVRLAPRRFSLGLKEHQMVKLLYRRKPGIANGEYQGVLAIKCKEKAGSSNEKVKVTAALVHNVPVILRTGKLPIKAQFISTKINGNNIDVAMKIGGERSLTGTITLINQASGEVLFEKKNISIYAQQPIKKLVLPFTAFNNIPLIVKFTENSEFGGELTIQQPVN